MWVSEVLEVFAVLPAGANRDAGVVTLIGVFASIIEKRREDNSDSSRWWLGILRRRRFKMTWPRPEPEGFVLSSGAGLRRELRSKPPRGAGCLL